MWNREWSLFLPPVRLVAHRKQNIVVLRSRNQGFSSAGTMVRLTADLIWKSPHFFNAIKERELDLRGKQLSPSSPVRAPCFLGLGFLTCIWYDQLLLASLILVLLIEVSGNKIAVMENLGATEVSQIRLLFSFSLSLLCHMMLLLDCVIRIYLEPVLGSHMLVISGRQLLLTCISRVIDLISLEIEWMLLFPGLSFVSSCCLYRQYLYQQYNCCYVSLKGSHCCRFGRLKLLTDKVCLL